MRYFHLPAVILTLISSTVWLYVLFKVSPYNNEIVRPEILVLFFISLWMWIAGICTLVLFAFRRWRWEFMPIHEAQLRSIRQGLLIGAAISMLLGLSMTSTLNFLTAALTIIVLIALELVLG